MTNHQISNLNSKKTIATLFIGLAIFLSAPLAAHATKAHGKLASFERILSYYEVMRLTPAKRTAYVRGLRRMFEEIEAKRASQASNDPALDEASSQIAQLLKLYALMVPEAEAADADPAASSRLPYLSGNAIRCDGGLLPRRIDASSLHADPKRFVCRKAALTTSSCGPGFIGVSQQDDGQFYCATAESFDQVSQMYRALARKPNPVAPPTTAAATSAFKASGPTYESLMTPAMKLAAPPQPGAVAPQMGKPRVVPTGPNLPFYDGKTVRCNGGMTAIRGQGSVKSSNPRSYICVNGSRRTSRCGAGFYAVNQDADGSFNCATKESFDWQAPETQVALRQQHFMPKVFTLIPGSSLVIADNFKSGGPSVTDLQKRVPKRVNPYPGLWEDPVASCPVLRNGELVDVAPPNFANSVRARCKANAEGKPLPPLVDEGPRPAVTRTPAPRIEVDRDVLRGDDRVSLKGKLVPSKAPLKGKASAVNEAAGARSRGQGAGGGADRVAVSGPGGAAGGDGGDTNDGDGVGGAVLPPGANDNGIAPPGADPSKTVIVRPIGVDGAAAVASPDSPVAPGSVNPKLASCSPESANAETCDATKIEDARRKYVSDANPDCIYAGGVTGYENGQKRSFKCAPPHAFCFASRNCQSDAGEAMKPDYTCGSSKVICNPLLYGVKSDGKTPFCVSREARATSTCDDLSSAAEGAVQPLDQTHAGIREAWNDFADRLYKICHSNETAKVLHCEECQIVRKRLFALNVAARDVANCGDAIKFENANCSADGTCQGRPGAKPKSTAGANASGAVTSNDASPSSRSDRQPAATAAPKEH